ncbi:hypothetical protein PEV8663_04637 [Pelagimonas varians]|uniref:Uncharacterized protein n=1 Tax=Pelagimonas varians TaxID=696760 RepID=A0A238L5Q9_9RHOB|nr:hypothetical protein PEV8663_04637 [Pelagimonas varians]
MTPCAVMVLVLDQDPVAGPVRHWNLTTIWTVALATI